MNCCDCLQNKCRRKGKVAGLMGCLSEAEIKVQAEIKI